MIRINLLPVRQVKKHRAGQRQLLIFGALVAAEVLAMVLLYTMKADEAASKKRQAAQIEAEVEALKKTVGDFDQLQAQRTQLISQRDVINQLQKSRSGPVWVMRELSDILTMGKGPTVDQAKYDALLRQNPAAGFNPRWNPNRLWLETFEEATSTVKLSGKAKDYDDVSEFNKRMSMSKYFSEVYLEKTEQVTDSALSLKVVKFSLRCKVSPN
jgi:type IV pilus assembly protein PilN